MGFLNHSTNNIIIDAVLTEAGREKLSRQDGSFVITQFSFGDDEVDYTNITKYGKIIGKEKIEKNTPIFEASTNENIALKNKLLVSLGNPSTRILYIPILKSFIDQAGTSPLTQVNLIFGTLTPGDKEKTLFINTNIESETTNTILDSAIVDDNFTVKINSDILSLKQNGNQIQPIETEYKIASYRIQAAAHPTTSKSNQGLKQIEFTVCLKSTLTTDTFSKFGRSGDATKIDTTIQISGNKSGATIVLPVQVNLGNA